MNAMNGQINRLAEGGRIDRGRQISFWFDGKQYYGYHGDTLAAALLACGVTVVARSFKYHRPRGVFSAGPEEPNALVQLERGARTEPNRRATEIELYDGLVAHSQNRWPSLKYDIGAINSFLWRLLPAGFYYKTFIWPRRLWLFYEKWIRRAAGLGRAPREPDPDAYDKFYFHCDVLVVGGGAAGLQAAYAAGVSGARVLLVDERDEFGGQLLHAADEYKIDGMPAREWVARRVAALRAMESVELRARTTATGYYDYNFVVACERVTGHLPMAARGDAPKERLWKIRAKQVVLTTGAIERPLVFADNDRPGVMLAGALRAYINRFAVLPGKRALVLTNNDSAYLAATDAARAGAAVTVADIRADPRGELVTQAKSQNIPVHTDHTVSNIQYARGQITGAEIMQLSPDGNTVYGKPQVIPCDMVAVSGGWMPAVHLFTQSKGELRFDMNLHCYVPRTTGAAPPPNHLSNSNFCAGACGGAATLAQCLRAGGEAGEAAARAAGSTPPPPPRVTVTEPKLDAIRPLWILPCAHPIGRGPKKHFHELHNDATIADIALAAREGFSAVEHLKRYTTTGMGVDQGKTSNLNALAALSKLRGMDMPVLGFSTYRPPYTPLTFGAIAGHERREVFMQQRTTPMHAWHRARGAVFEDVGDWQRPFYFARSGESMHTAVQRECLNARRAVGLLDASTLGKIDLRGRDAVKLLNMVYTNSWDNLRPGRCRYGVMLNEHGMVFDDGVTTCLGEHHYHMTTTTGGAARVLNWLEEYLQTEWPHYEVYCTSVTEQWAVAALNGPNSRKVLAELCAQPLDNENFPFMSMREVLLAGVPARIFRVSFSGELAFEINVPARFGRAVWEALFAAGEPYGIQPYGTEAMHVLRAEKGFIIVGQDTDGTVTPADLGMHRLLGKNKTDFIGKRALSRPDTARQDRKQLVGLRTEDPEFILPEGAHLVVAGKRKSRKIHGPIKTLGHISSSYMSPNVGRSIAMGLIQDGFQRRGETVEAVLPDGAAHQVTIVSPVFFDPDGGRARA